ncbi:hypothetical protein K449DRAFT_437726 [Hypoxylon sp. EC38]|nr:hypothetical protein K449DRAFT_437726 [Hypoxylon sp. EC38]
MDLPAITNHYFHLNGLRPPLDPQFSLPVCLTGPSSTEDQVQGSTSGPQENTPRSSRDTPILLVDLVTVMVFWIKCPRCHSLGKSRFTSSYSSGFLCPLFSCAYIALLPYEVESRHDLNAPCPQNARFG